MGVKMMGQVFRSFLGKYGEDFLILGGIFSINLATFQFGVTAGLYCLGVSLLLLGYAVARQ